MNTYSPKKLSVNSLLSDSNYLEPQLSQFFIYYGTRKDTQASSWECYFREVDALLPEGDLSLWWWRRPNGSLQAARGQARIETYEQMMALINQAKEEGFFERD